MIGSDGHLNKTCTGKFSWFSAKLDVHFVQLVKQTKTAETKQPITLSINSIVATWNVHMDWHPA